jgi:protein TonB
MAALIHGLAALFAAAGASAAPPPPEPPPAFTRELHRDWAPDCADLRRNLQIRVEFTVDQDGRLVDRVTAGGAEKSRDPHVRSAAQRAIQAVYNAAPFRSLPPEFFGERIAVTFDAAEACS